MLHRWGCPTCKFVVWAPERSTVTDAIRSHLIDHHKDQVTTLFRTRWTCPRCGQQGAEMETNDAVDAFSKHLLKHEVGNIVSDVGFFETVEEPAAKLMAASRESKAMDYIRRRNIRGQDGVIFVTPNPEAKFRFLTERASAVPNHVVFITPQTGESPDLDTAGQPFKVVVRTAELRLETLGGILSETIQEYDFGGDDIAVDFELLGTLDSQYGSKRTFEFLHLLIGILNRCRAASIFAVNKDQVSAATVNVYGSLFEVAIHEKSGRYTIVPSSKAAKEHSLLAEPA